MEVRLAPMTGRAGRLKFLVGHHQQREVEEVKGDRGCRPGGALGPYTRVIDRGAWGAVKGNTREGHFLAAFQQKLKPWYAGKPSSISH